MNSSTLFRSVPLVIATFVSVACGGSQPAAETAPPGGEKAEAAPASEVPWADMNKEQRASFMMQVVTPKMKEAFTTFDAAHFSKLNCVTCHGDGAKDKSFAMPNPQLPKIPGTMEGFEKLKAEKPEVVKFMLEVVTPEMAKMLQEPLMDPATGKGFGCGECHVKE